MTTGSYHTAQTLFSIYMTQLLISTLIRLFHPARLTVQPLGTLGNHIAIPLALLTQMVILFNISLTGVMDRAQLLAGILLALLHQRHTLGVRLQHIQ